MIRQKSCETALKVKAEQLQHTAQGALRKWQIMVPEIPIGSGHTTDVWTDADQLPTRAKAAVDLLDRAAEVLLATEMLKEIAREDAIQRIRS